MTLPNFIIIGAARCGTTSLYEYLRQHPDIAMSDIKETNYFAWEVEKDRTADVPVRRLEEFYPVRTWADYQAQFGHAGSCPAVGEATPRYQFVPGVAECIHAHLPEVRLIAILRDPTRRAWAHYMVKHRLGREPRGFMEVIEDELQWHENVPLAAGGGCLVQGFYHRNLMRFLKLFPRERLLVLLHDDLRSDADGTVRTIFRFLGVDDGVPLDLSNRFAPAGMAQSTALEALMTNPISAAIERNMPRSMLKAVHLVSKPLRRRNTVRPKIPPEAETMLREIYRPDIRALETLLDRDLGAWLARGSKLGQEPAAVEALT